MTKYTIFSDCVSLNYLIMLYCVWPLTTVKYSWLQGNFYQYWEIRRKFSMFQNCKMPNSAFVWTNNTVALHKPDISSQSFFIFFYFSLFLHFLTGTLCRVMTPTEVVRSYITTTNTPSMTNDRCHSKSVIWIS